MDQRAEDLKTRTWLTLIQSLLELEDADLLVRLIIKARKHGLFFPHSRHITIKTQKLLAKLLSRSIEAKLILQERTVVLSD